MNELTELKKLARDNGCFIFAKGGAFFMYRECVPKNVLVATNKKFELFATKVKKVCSKA